jgi:hypothetical protein
MAHLRDELGTKVGVAEFDKKLRGLGTSGPTLAEESSLGLSHDPPLFNVSGVEISQLQTYRVLDFESIPGPSSGAASFPIRERHGFDRVPGRTSIGISNTRRGCQC